MLNDEKQIRDQLDRAIDNNGKHSAMSYEDGVTAALQWVLEDTNKKPIKED